MKFFVRFVISFFIVLCVSVLGIYLFNTYQNIDVVPNYEISSLDSTYQEQTVENVIENSKNVADVVEEVSKCVVGISRLKNNGGSIFSKSTEAELGLGTGVVVASDGYILSNSHVTGEKLSTCYVTLENGKTYEGSVVWSSSDLDLSITKIKATNLNFVTIGDSSNLKSGQTVYAIGNPIGFEFRRTVTSGIISATNRTIRLEESGNITFMTDLIQTDASINSGNSGGPLILPNGEVVGINTVKITSAEGIGFAVPINVIKPVIDSFVSSGDFTEATIGIYAYDKEIIPYLSNTTNFTNGIYVASILPNSPASFSDLQVRRYYYIY